MLDDIVEIRDILGDGEARQRLSGSSIGGISGNSSDNLNTVSFGEEENRPTTNAIDGNTINEVGVPMLLPCADVAGKEAERMRSDGGEPEPTNLSTDFDNAAHWKKCYRALWDIKIAFEKENDRRVCFPVPINNSVFSFEK